MWHGLSLLRQSDIRLPSLPASANPNMIDSAAYYQLLNKQAAEKVLLHRICVDVVFHIQWNPRDMERAGL